MRDEIESLRVERCRFDQLYKKLDKELTALRRQKGQLIEESTQAYDSRLVLTLEKVILMGVRQHKDRSQEIYP